EANPGQVWEETEFWIDLSWQIDPDGALGIRRYFESPYRPGERITVDDYFGWMFENSVPGLPEAAAREGLKPLAYMRRCGALATRTYIKSHVHPDNVDRAANEFVLLSTYRLPTLIHTRSGNAKWLLEISHTNPTWMHTSDAARLGVGTGDLVRIETEIGHSVD